MEAHADKPTPSNEKLIENYTIRSLLGGFLLSFLFLFTSCGGDKTVCKLTIEWDNAPMDKYTSSPVPMHLYVTYQNAEREQAVDTISLESSGKWKAELEVPIMGESDLALTTSFSSLYIPLKAQAGRNIKLQLDWNEPWLYTATGYPEVALRTKLIGSLRKDYRRLRHAQQRGDSLQAKLEEETILQAVASYIDKNAQLDASEALAKEFFPGWRGAKRFAFYTQKDTIARSLKYLHANFEFYRSYQRERQLQGTSYPLLDTLNTLLSRKEEPYEKVVLLELLPPSSLPFQPSNEKQYSARLYADTTSEALFILSYPYDSIHVPQLLPYPAVSDSSKIALVASSREEKAKALRSQIDSLKRKEKGSDSAYKKRLALLQKEVDSLQNQAKKDRADATKLGKLSEKWRKEPRRIVLPPYKTGWYRLREMNRIEELPHYFVLGRSRNILYSGGSVDSALLLVDSLLLEINRTYKLESDQ